MKPSLKYTFLCALLVVAVQFWALAVISDWLTCNDSKAVADFNETHQPLACLAALIWGADKLLGGRYLVMLFLGAIFWWVMKQKKHEPPAEKVTGASCRGSPHGTAQSYKCRISALSASTFMSVERKDGEFGGQVAMRVLGGILIPGFIMLPVLASLSSPMKTWQVVVCIAGPLSAAVAIGFLLHRLHSRYHCRHCGAHLPPQKPAASSRYEYRFYCKTCDIVWTTGVFQGED